MPPSLRKNHAQKSSVGTALKRRFAINLSSTTVAALGLALAAVVGWAFFMGFMVGRGQNPEQRVEQLTNSFRHEPPASPAQTTPTEPEPAAQTQAPAPVEATAANPALPSSQAETYQFNRPQGAGMAAWGIPPDTAAQQAPAAQAKNSGEQAKKTNAPLFDYLFQVAAFKSKNEADALRTKLNGRGMRSGQNKDGKMFLVMVNLRGSEEDAASLREELQKMRLGAPILASKKPVPITKPKPPRKP